MIPKKVKIGWRVYTVEVCDNLEFENEEAMGSFQVANHTIKISSEIGYEEQVCTLIHEILHGIFLNGGQEDARCDEGIIECVASGMYQLLRDNPKLIDAIKETK